MDDRKKDVSRFIEKSYEVEAIITFVLWVAVIFGLVAYALYLAWTK